MAMFLFYNRVLVILLIEFLLILCDNGFLTKGKTTVSANGNTEIQGPSLQIEKPNKTRLIITKPHLPHFLYCIATIEDTYSYQNETAYFFTWFRNDNVLESSGEAWRRNDFYIYRNGSLRLPPNEKSSGVYRCKINANTTAVLSESIKVEYPVLKRMPAVANISAFGGLPLTFHCPVLSVPPANISWFYGNVSLSKTFKDNRYLILANGSLVIRKLTQNDGGKYKCLAQNQFAAKLHRQFIWSLTPNMRTNRTQSYAQLIPHLQDTTHYIPLGSDLKLHCRGLTDLVPIEWWFRNATAPPIKLSNHSYEYHIRNASIAEHEGNYMCSTSTDNQTFHVIVTIPPKILSPLRSYESLINARVKFECRSTGNPRPVISWYHNGVSFNSSYTRYISGNELLIPSFDPGEDGIYQCFARNIAGEVYTAGEIRYRRRGEEIPNPLHNIRCFAHSSNTINVTFDSKSAEPLFMVSIVQNDPYRWINPFAAMKLNHTSYVIIISSKLPFYRPFVLITRVLFPTSEIRSGNKPQQQTILSSLRSPPVTCCTQGLPLHLVHLGNDTFVTWSEPGLDSKKYFILQFSINYTNPHPQQLLDHALRGTIRQVELTPDDVEKKLTQIEALNRSEGRAVLQRAENKYIDNDARAGHLEAEEDIFSLVVPANVTGVLLTNFSLIKMRVLFISTENEDLAQDFRYVQWKIIENDTNEWMNSPFRLITKESRMLVFHFLDSFNESCVHVCYWQIQFPIINREERKCENHILLNSQLEIRSLKPSELYRLNFSRCVSLELYGQLDVKTFPDPPGTISNQRVTRHNGLKLSWDPPLQPNGKIHHYNILWTLVNVTHEANVLECSLCFYKFPNISETAKINVTVRVVGETGVGAPIFIDLRNINHNTLEVEHSSSPNSEVYSGIAIGSLLSTFCVFCFALLIILQRRRFKARQQGPTHLTSPSDMNFGNLSNTGIPGDSAGGLSGSTLQQDCHEMQTLIPRSGRHIVFLTDRPGEYQTTQLPNGNGNIPRRQEHSDQEQNTSLPNEFDGGTGHNLSQIPLCSSTPERKVKDTPPHDAKPFFIAFKSVPNAALQKNSSSISFQCDSSGQLALGTASLPSGNDSSNGSARRSGSLSNSSASSSSSGSKAKQFHTNFPKHSKSNDGICLLAEEESSATLTPTSETDVIGAALTNGFKATAEIPTVAVHTHTTSDVGTSTTTPTSRSNSLSQANINNNNSNKKNATKTRDTKNTNLTGRPQTAHLSTTSIVPAIGPAAAATTSTAAAKHWSNTSQPKPTTSTTTTAAAAAPPANNLHRRPNVDPNG